jgi:hypothetical protein
MNKQAIKNKTIPVITLQEGSNFQIPSLGDILKDLTVVSSNASAALVTGKKLKSKETNDDGNEIEHWVDFRDYISAGTQVVVDYERAEKLPKMDKAAKTTKATKAGRPGEEDQQEAKVEGKRGRRRLYDIVEIPTGEDFKVKDLAARLNVPPFVVHNELMKLKKAGRNVVTVSEIKGGRGKPTKVFRLEV